MLEDIQQRLPAIRSLCEASAVRRLELFGSAARGEFHATQSDLDFLVEFEDLGWQGSSKRYFDLQFGLEDLLGVRVDLVETSAVKNPHFMKVANRHRVLLYRRSTQAA